MYDLLPTEQLDNYRHDFIPDWELVRNKILQKKFRANDYEHAIEWFYGLNDVQTELDHFADIAFFYNEILVQITTKDIDGLAKVDFILAKAIDSIAQQYNIEAVRA